jgi:hypothetical protein
MRSSPALPILVLALIVAGSAVGVVGQTTPTATPASENVPDSGVTIAIQLEPDGDARWNVSARFPLRSENDSQAFEGLVEDFRNGDAGFDVGVFEAAASEAATQTGRQMEIRNDEKSTHRDNDTGVLSLSFTWTNFSRVSGGRLVVGDAFATESGTWLPRLTADQTLVISPPDGYILQSTQWPVINRSLVIDGSQTFERGEPSITYVGDGTPTPDDPDIGALPLLFVALLSAAIAGVYAWTRHQGSGPFDGLWSGDDEDAGEVEPAGEVLEEPAVAEDADEPTDEDIDPTLLSDEERVLRLLKDNDGRMKQATIVKETGWSNAKVSQLLSAMAEEGQVEKLRIGRENLISLPDEEFGEFE